jgi:uncharacterized membrane protein
MATTNTKLLVEPISKNIESIIGLQSRHEQGIPRHLRVLEKIAASFGQPRFLYIQLIFFVIWGIFSYSFPDRLTGWDLPKLDLHQDWIGISSLFISTSVLVYQTRDGKLSEERSLLMLQMSLLTEQKLAKLISLIEELRTDLPDVRDRQDLEAEIMKQVIDPQVVLDMFQEALEQTIEKEVEKDVEALKAMETSKT